MGDNQTDVGVKIAKDPDFVAIPRYSHSLSKLLDRYPDKVPNHIISQALGMTDEEVSNYYNGIVEELQYICCNPK